MDTTWFNGQRVGAHEGSGQHRTPRRYTIAPEHVSFGADNVIAVRVFDSGGAGGFGGKAEAMTLSVAGDEEAAQPLAGSWHYRSAAPSTDLAAWPRKIDFHHNSPTALYNGMIAPLLPFAIRGAIWYQGESNRTRAHQYRTLFPTMITDWRRDRHRDRG